MATLRTVPTALFLLLVVGACTSRSDRSTALSDELKRDLAAAASSSGDLAGAPQSYRPMRFVSTVERAHAAAPARRITAAHRRVKAKHSRQPAPEVASATPDAASTMVSEAPAPVSTPDAATVEEVVIAHQPSTAPASQPSPSSSGGDVGGAHGHGGGWGEIIGGLIGAAVIRGGIGTVDKCDPRTDGRRPRIIDRQDIGLPPGMGDLPGMGRTTFPRTPRR